MTALLFVDIPQMHHIFAPTMPVAQQAQGH
jgi:hypothetical protein